MKRRAFLQVLSGSTGAVALGQPSAFGAETAAGKTPAAGPLPQRVLGRTGQSIPVVGFPGLCLIHYDQDECTAGLRAALGRGVSYFDVAPAYGKGQCEIKMGIGLEGIDRQRYFLACKTMVRDKAGARADLQRSLEALKTDHFDLYQIHCLRSLQDVQQVLAPDGALRTLLEAREQGQVKHLGFSAHTTKAALAAMQGFRFDTVMFPINFVELLGFGIGKEVLELAHQQGVAVLAIKVLLRGAWRKDETRARKWWYRCTEDAEEANLAVRFTLSQPGVAAVIPPSFLDLLDKAVDGAHDPRPITPAEVERLTAIARSCESVFQKEAAKVSRADRPCCPHWV